MPIATPTTSVSVPKGWTNRHTDWVLAKWNILKTNFGQNGEEIPEYLINSWLSLTIRAAAYDYSVTATEDWIMLVVADPDKANIMVAEQAAAA